MSARVMATMLVAVPHFILHNRHDADDCGVVFAAFRGFTSPLRHTAALVSCRSGGHEIWWRVVAGERSRGTAPAAALRRHHQHGDPSRSGHRPVIQPSRNPAVP
jgi:hypothetical protein